MVVGGWVVQAGGRAGGGVAAHPARQLLAEGEGSQPGKPQQSLGWPDGSFCVGGDGGSWGVMVGGGGG